MSEEENKAIDELIMLKHFLETEEKYEGQERKVNAIKTVLNLITKLQKENEEKDRQIDLMAIRILVNIIGNYPCKYKKNCIKSDKEYRDIHCKECIKQYFETKAKKGE